eukprot:CAMPEP_0169123796 /NCGR_PEP_ID=MMETSP1015-20121227/33979_1 /TAXON_ID=342587 /ORGANISM="Karlodinium micrum, Strain CCMP2283" /LENGTH=218 /DNA_ID=CAMNT_0009187163 /DNA_START=131 /DNA_END=787 /DNA_ORIENTATION=+
MGKDKFENETLIANAWPEDIWFHVDKYSSAHIYLRLPAGSVELMGVKDKDVAKKMLQEALASVPKTVIDEMCQLTKANSIEGCKLAQCDIVYTPALNLKKEERMDTGQVGFKDESFRLLLRNVEKDKEIVKQIEKTRNERNDVDLVEEKQQRDNEERSRRKQAIAEEKRKAKEEEAKRAEEKELKSYTALQNLEKTSNENVNKSGTIDECREIEDDFM